MGDGVRQENLAARGRGQEATEAVETGSAIVSVRLGLDLADMESHSYRGRGCEGPRLSLELLLCLNGGNQRVQSRVKRCLEGVPDDLVDDPAARLDRLAQDGVVPGVDV